MKISIIAGILLLCVMFFVLGRRFLSDEIKASVIFFGTILGVMLISGILIVVGVKAVIKYLTTL